MSACAPLPIPPDTDNGKQIIKIKAQRIETKKEIKNQQQDIFSLIDI